MLRYFPDCDMTEQHGPFYVERQGNIIAIRSKQPFSGTICQHVKSEQQAAIFALPPMGLQDGMKIILSTVGHDDVVIEG